MESCRACHTSTRRPRRPSRHQCRAEAASSRGGHAGEQQRTDASGATAWQGMGTASPCRSTAISPPLPTLGLVFIVMTTIWGSGLSCGIDKCWHRYTIAQQALEINGRNPLYAKCVALRTYSYCIRNMTRGCFSDIKFHSIQKVVENQMKQHNCSANGPIFNGTRPPPTQAQGRAVCSYPGAPEHRHCGLFGDPHLRTFDNEFQTCKVQGAWPLVDNEYLTVQVTNDPVGSTDGATATSKLTVVIKENSECGSHHFLTYLAQSYYLPATFDDGRSHAGPERSVQITEVEPGRRVEIYIRYIDTTILVRQVGRYFTFAIRMPEEIVNNSRQPHGIQLCVKGCPRSERIDYKEFIAQKHGRLKAASNGAGASKVAMAMSRDLAETKCRFAQVVDFYFDSCVFDLMVTGDTNFTQAANIALRDVFRLSPEAAKQHSNRTNLDVYDVFTNSATRTSAGSLSSHRTLLYSVLFTLCTVTLLVKR